MKNIRFVGKLLSPGIKSIFPNRLRRYWLLIYILIAILSVLCAICFNLKITLTISNLVLPALSIFTALVFSSIFIVPEQLLKRIQDYQQLDDEAIVNYLITYHNFIKLFSRQLISLVFLSLIIILFILCSQFTSSDIFIQLLTGGLFPLTLSFILLIIAVISNISKMIDDNIDFSAQIIQKKKDNLNND